MKITRQDFRLTFTADEVAQLSTAERQGYLAAAKPAADGSLTVDAATYAAVQRARAPRNDKLPTVANLAANFADAMSGWAKAGFPVVSEAVYKSRADICAACPHWDGAARLGLGRCRAPGCGCTKLKRWLATEKCPLGKWEATS